MTSEHNIRRFEAVQEQLHALDIISNLLTSSSFDLDSLLQEIVKITTEMLQVKACSLRLYDETRGEMILKAVHGLSEHYQTKGPVLARESIYQEMIESRDDGGKVVEIFDISQDTRVQYTQEAISEGIHSMLAIPLRRNGKVIGAMSILTMTPHHFSEEETRTFKTIANQAGAAISLAQLHQDLMDLERIEQELKIAANIQSRFMPTTTPQIEGIELAGWNRACREVGGDFYDYIELPQDNFGIALGDVSGKGIPAALLMTAVRTSLRVQAENIYSMSEVISRVNHALIKDTNLEEFATLFYAVLDLSNWMLTFINAGHNHPLLLRGAEVLPLRTGGIPVGLFRDAVYTQGTLQIVPGDLLVIYSDGFTEAPNAQWEQFGEERLVELVKHYRDHEPAEIIRALEQSVTEYLSPNVNYSDDRTIVIMKAHN
ncbi:MAG TPA: GAF domain-containing SpoIIE family protein phosphatase [bacterium]|nr:GAF domain-containing SpoIIE family protein phosphatase [bacterium]